MAIILVCELDTTDSGHSIFRFFFLPLPLPLPLPLLPASVVVFELFTFLVLAVAKTFVPHFIQDISAPHVQFLLVSYFARFRPEFLSLRFSLPLSLSPPLAAYVFFYIYFRSILLAKFWPGFVSCCCCSRRAQIQFAFICFVSVFLTSNTYLNFMNLNFGSSW